MLNWTTLAYLRGAAVLPTTNREGQHRSCAAAEWWTGTRRSSKSEAKINFLVFTYHKFSLFILIKLYLFWKSYLCSHVNCWSWRDDKQNYCFVFEFVKGACKSYKMKFQRRTCPAWLSDPGRVPNPPSKLMQEQTKSTAFSMSTQSRRSRRDRQATAQKENLKFTISYKFSAFDQNLERESE